MKNTTRRTELLRISNATYKAAAAAEAHELMGTGTAAAAEAAFQAAAEAHEAYIANVHAAETAI